VALTARAPSTRADPGRAASAGYTFAQRGISAATGSSTLRSASLRWASA